MLPIDLNPTTTEVRKLDATDIFINSETVAGSSGVKPKNNPLHKAGLQSSAFFLHEVPDNIDTGLIGLEGISQTPVILEKTDPKFIANSEKVSEIRNIYFQDGFVTRELKTGINLLESSQELISKSIQSFREGKRKDSDEFVMEFKAFIPELFCCRTISESFGAVIKSIGTALSNMKGTPLSEPQLMALSNIITTLLREPAMPFMKAVAYISEFEKADFEVESVGLGSLLKLVEMMDNPEVEIVNG